MQKQRGGNFSKVNENISEVDGKSYMNESYLVTPIVKK